MSRMVFKVKQKLNGCVENLFVHEKNVPDWSWPSHGEHIEFARHFDYFYSKLKLLHKTNFRIQNETNKKKWFPTI
jgi:hypothetical protein